jgi:hypothetical protein
MGVVEEIFIKNTDLGVTERPFKDASSREVGQLVRVAVLQVVLQFDRVVGREVCARVAASLLECGCPLRGVGYIVRSVGSEKNTTFLNLFEDHLPR